MKRVLLFEVATALGILAEVLVGGAELDSSIKVLLPAVVFGIEFYLGGLLVEAYCCLELSVL